MTSRTAPPWAGIAGRGPQAIPTLRPTSPIGGPLGAGDAYLRLRGRGGLSSGSKPTAINVQQWTGSYSAAGVTRISADVRNAGPTQLALRFQLMSLLGKIFVTAPVMVPSGSDWVRATWLFDAANLIPIDVVPGDPAQALTGLVEVRLVHNPQPTISTDAPPIVADYGIDNIRAEAAVTDGDGDAIPDGVDNCPFTANPTQLDSDGNGRGNACTCGDQNGDGTVDVLDLVAINLAIFNPALRTPLCDANNDQNCSVNDIVAANVEIFSVGSTAICAAQPLPGP